ncbi:MAG: hypothetical protein OHK0046_25300 [Anaerolineae bacterium]
MKMRSALLVLCGCLTLLAVFQSITTVSAQAPTTNDCDIVRYLMDNQITPYDLTLGGGVLEPGQQVTQAVTNGYYADTWTFNTTRAVNQVGNSVADTFSVTFDRVSTTLNLEIGMFSGLTEIRNAAGNTDYQTVVAGETYNYSLDSAGVYTFVVRRSDVSNQDAGVYAFTPQFTGDPNPITLPVLRDDTTSGQLATQPTLVDGKTLIDLPASDILIHPGATTSVGTHDGLASSIRFRPAESGNGIFVNNWMNYMKLLGGDLAMTGFSTEGVPRIFYLKDYGHQIDLRDVRDGNFGDAVVDSKGTRFRLNWDAMAGAWILKDCAGFRLKDGRTFTGTIDRTNRDVGFSGTYEAFTIRLVSPLPEAASAVHQATLNWNGITPGSETTLRDGLFTAQIVNNRAIRLGSRDINWRIEPPINDISDQQRYLIDLRDRGTSLELDWVDIAEFELIGDRLTTVFLTEDPRTSNERTAANLARFDAIGGVLRFVYRGEDEAGVNGEQRLILPADESYLEIVTPPGLPAFNGTALPGEPGYAPRGLNNLGGECYPINTLQPQANCPPNGHLNPANSNLWLAVPDLLAQGGDLDLALTRSYNSALPDVSGPFGLGWTTEYLLDYNVTFNETTNSRIVDQAAVATYPVGLDLIWAPRGVVTLTTFSGSRHAFVAQGDSYTTGELRALTMPGWILTRSDIRANWFLRQDDGLTYEFDRAGRIASYGYPERDHVIRVSYPDVLLNGPQTLGDLQPVIITDDASQRRLELYFDDNNHIVRSVLRETTGIPVLEDINVATCSPEANCFETLYTYTGDLLTGVRYADGRTATYTYDEDNRLIAHNDPRAPIAPSMVYTYGELGDVTAEIVLADGELVLWQSVSSPAIDDEGEQRAITLTEQTGARRTFTYALEAGALKQVGSSFTLLQETSPLAGVTQFETQPIRYEWVNGLLSLTLPRVASGNNGRNSVGYEYIGTGGYISRIRTGYPGFSATYQEFGSSPTRYLPQTLAFAADNTQITITYDSQGRISTVNDRQGGIYAYTWSSDNRVQTILSDNDSTAIDYTYNNLGLVTSVTQRRVNDPAETWYTITYAYDGLGRLTRVEDPLTGGYTITYSLLPEDEHFNIQMEVTDATNTVVTSVFDGLGYLLEQRATTLNSAGYLRHTTYTYDEQRRLATQTEWLAPLPDETVAEQRLTTSYQYTVPFATLPNLPGENEEGSRRVINGYQIQVIDPLGRTSRYTFDALERIRQTEDEFGLIKRYDYEIYSDENVVNGLRVTERAARATGVIETTRYIFDLRWQLRQVTRGPIDPQTGDPAELWDLFFDGDSPRYRALASRSSNVLEQRWGTYINGLPRNVERVPVPIALNSGTTIPNARQDVLYDFLGRPLRLIDSTNTAYNLTYCPLEGGGTKTLYLIADAPDALPLAEGQTAPTIPFEPIDCDSFNITYAVYQDAQGRLTRVDDANGTRLYTYSLQPDGWLVDVAMGEYNWQLRYNGLGELVEWVDASGIQRSYTYDTLGQLRAVTVPDQPEASFVFRYNQIGLLTAQLDGAGRGTFYDYDELGRLIVQQDARTANSTIFGYNTNGQLSIISDPRGNTTSFGYEEDDPTRLSDIIESTGNVTQFNWDDANNRLIYINSLANQTVYRFDSFGALWRVDDAIGRSHEVIHNGAGQITSWRQSQPADPLLPPAFQLQLIRDIPEQSLTIQETSEAIEWQRRFEMNANNQLTSVEGTLNNPLLFAYDTLGRVTTATNNDGQTWSWTRMPNMPAVLYSDGFGQTQVLQFDALNRLVGAQSDSGLSTLYTYVRGRAADVDLFIEAEGADTTVYTITAGDNTARPPTIIRRSPGRRTTYVFEREGLITEIISETCFNDDYLTAADTERPDDCITTAPDSAWRTIQRISYDAQGRPVRVIDEEQNIEVFAYDDVGNLSTYQDVNGKTFNYTYDPLNRLESITGPTGIRLFLRYTNNDQVSGICRGRVEDRGGYTECAASGGELETYTYDPLARLTTQSFSTQEDQFTILQAYGQQNEGLLTGWRVDDPDSNVPGVSIERTGDGLGLLRRVNTSSQTYTYTYKDLFHLAEINGTENIIYVYDEFDQLVRIIFPDFDLNIQYLDTGYAIEDEVTGNQITFELDERGLLTQIGSDAQFTYFLEDSGLVMVVQIQRGDGELIEMRFDRRGETLELGYNTTGLFISYVSDAAGRTQRQSIIGPPEFFIPNVNGYITVIGYDSDDRPLTIRINDRSTGELLYRLSFTYGPLGQRQTETRQYSDGTQVDVRSTFAVNRLVQRTVSVRRSSVLLNGSPFLLLIGFMAWLMRAPSRRRALFGMTIVGALTMLVLSLTGAQQSNALTRVYDYDPAGNLTAIRIPDADLTCASYEYDNANRLTRTSQVIQSEDGELEEDITSYTYDAWNRLSTVNGRRLIYQGDSTTLLAVQDDNNNLRFYGKTQSLPAFYQIGGEEPIWLFHDGRSEILTANVGDTLATPLWLFDPLGRFLPLAPPDLTTNPCGLFELPDLLSEISPVQTLMDDIVWDGTTNLYFVNGRAYAPELGRFLQRDPYGPDALGNVYSFPSRQNQPPVRERPPGYVIGLYRLQEALSVIRAADRLTAANLAAIHTPRPDMHMVEPLIPLLEAVTDQTQNALYQQLQFPTWLANNYNLPGAFLDDDGALRLLRDNAPAQGGLRQSFNWQSPIFDPMTMWLPNMQPPMARLAQLDALATPRDQLFTLYEPFAWQPGVPRLQKTWQNQLPQLDVLFTPSAVMAWLPQPLTQPEIETLTLDVVQALQAMPERNGAAWLEAAIALASPGDPILPPDTREEWLTNWFSYDTLGVAEMLAERWPTPPGTDLPTYDVGLNPNWNQ